MWEMILGFVVKLRFWPTLAAGATWVADEYGHYVREWAAQNPDATGLLILVLTLLANLAKSPVKPAEAETK